MIDNIIENKAPKTITCKYCGSNAHNKYGFYGGIQRYYCKVCRRKFKDDDSHFHMKVPSQIVISALSLHFTGMSFDHIRTNLKQQYSYCPSKSVIYKWVKKYSKLAQQQFKGYHPEVGDTWIIDETPLDIDGQHKVWFYDIIDKETRFILASRVTLTHKNKNMQSLLKEAVKLAGKIPKAVVSDLNRFSLEKVNKAFGGDTLYIQSQHIVKENEAEKSERLKRRMKLFKVFKDFKTVVHFSNGWLIYYNYFRPIQFLGGKTPAEYAKVNYNIKSWSDLGRFSPEKM
jgi:putative transposase